MYSKRANSFPLVSILVAVIAAAVMYYATLHGAGITPDSVSYIQGARALTQHGIYADLSPHWPPAYSMLLTVVGGPLGDFLLAARVLCIFLFGLNIYLVGALLRRCGWSVPSAALLSALLILTPGFVHIHLSAWSEPAFCTMLLGGLLALSHYHASQARRALLLAALAFGMSAIFRYAGLAFVCGAACLLLWPCLRPSDRSTRIRHLRALLIFVFMSLVPLGLWVLLKSRVDGNGGIRELVYHGIPLPKIDQLFISPINWFGDVLPGFFLVALAPLGAWVGKANLSDAAKQVLRMAGLLCGVYVAFVWVSLLFFDAAIPLDNRIVAPMKLLAYLIVAVSLLGVKPAWQPWASLALFAYGAAFGAADTYRLVSASAAQGIGFASVQIQGQPILQFVREKKLKLNAANSPEIALLYLDQEVAMVPPTYDPSNATVAKNQAELLGKVAKSGNIVVVFNSMLWRNYLMDAGQLKEAGFTDVLYDQADGVILRYP